MFLKTLCVFLVLGALGNGIPLENQSDNMSKFFSQRIVGGENAPEGYAPHMAALVLGYHTTSLVCGGSIVALNLILTAAHCIDMFVIWGELLTSLHGVVGTNRWDRGIDVYFKDFYVHPKWDWGTIKNDIGFLVLDQRLTRSTFVRVIALNFNRIEREEPSYVTGYGQLAAWPNDRLPYYLQLLNVTTISHKFCVKGVEAAAAVMGPAPHVDPKIEICTFHSYGHGMCNGDSGSALVSRKTNTQIGIVSWGFPCAVGAPDMFVRVSGFKIYIKNIMAKHL